MKRIHSFLLMGLLMSGSVCAMQNPYDRARNRRSRQPRNNRNNRGNRFGIAGRSLGSSITVNNQTYQLGDPVRDSRGNACEVVFIGQPTTQTGLMRLVRNVWIRRQRNQRQQAPLPQPQQNYYSEPMPRLPQQPLPQPVTSFQPSLMGFQPTNTTGYVSGFQPQNVMGVQPNFYPQQNMFMQNSLIQNPVEQMCEAGVEQLTIFISAVLRATGDRPNYENEQYIISLDNLSKMLFREGAEKIVPLVIQKLLLVAVSGNNPSRRQQYFSRMITDGLRMLFTTDEPQDNQGDFQREGSIVDDFINAINLKNLWVDTRKLFGNLGRMGQRMTFYGNEIMRRVATADYRFIPFQQPQVQVQPQVQPQVQVQPQPRVQVLPTQPQPQPQPQPQAQPQQPTLQRVPEMPGNGVLRNQAVLNRIDRARQTHPGFRDRSLQDYVDFYVVTEAQRAGERIDFYINRRFMRD